MEFELTDGEAAALRGRPDHAKTMVMNYSTMLFSFTGRLNRARYWLAAITTAIVGILIVLGIALGAGRAYPAEVALALAVFLALIWINLALAIKRLHDHEKSAGGCSRSMLRRPSWRSLDRGSVQTSTYS
jgi:uncharacterized membrane protein YhaH (DUF805 family)